MGRSAGKRISSKKAATRASIDGSISLKSKTGARRGRKLESTLKIMKDDLESVIKSGEFNGEKKSNGHEAATSFIRSQGLISHMHDYVKDQFIKVGVKPGHITPSHGQMNPELPLDGYYKNKTQDIVIASPEVWKNDRERAICVNLRSQFSSVDKNYDTIMERTAFESLNARLKHEEMVLGDVFILPVQGYLPAELKQNQVGFDRPTGLKKYIDFFKTINKETASKDNPLAATLAYDRVGLIIADFSLKTPKFYSTGEELAEDGWLKEAVDLSPISIDGFYEDILAIHKKRFPQGYA